jgi:hypothetical protein
MVVVESDDYNINNSNNNNGIDPTDRHIRILEESLLFAVQRREQMVLDNPDLAYMTLWKIDQDIAVKKRDLELVMERKRHDNRRNRCRVLY